jgi:hypothetical protein
VHNRKARPVATDAHGLTPGHVMGDLHAEER